MSRTGSLTEQKVLRKVQGEGSRGRKREEQEVR